MRGLLLLQALVGCAMACTAVDGDRILGRHLAGADVRFGALPAGMTVAFAPVPGRQRSLDTAFLSTLAGRYTISREGLAPVCFERPTEPLNATTLRAALERVLGPGIRLEIIDFSRYPVPRGELEFSMIHLVQPSSRAGDEPVVWRGRLRYGERSTVSVWAKVRVGRLENWLEAAGPIAARKPIEPRQIIAKSGWRFPFASPPPSDVSAVAGKCSTRSLAPGQMIVPALLTSADDVERDDVVDVEVVSGQVSLRFTARAETAGHRAETILIAATDTGKRYRARVVEKGKVVISADLTRKVLADGRPSDNGATAVRNADRSQIQENQAGPATILAGSIPR
jgi:flagella basal body P-ring formation protein FlgA